MALLDSLLGGGQSAQSVSVDGAVAAEPAVGLAASDVLHVLGGVDTGLASAVADVTGIGDLALGAKVPIAAAVDTDVDSQGGLLGLV
jgi:hypothetical protein